MKACFLLMAFSAAAVAQVTEGEVVNALTGAPVAGALVSFSSGMEVEAVTKTDAAGHFRLAAASAYLPLRVVHAGFLRSERPLLPSAGQGNAGRIELVPGATISGKIVDEEGLPVEAQVWAVQYNMANGKKTAGPVAMTQSDDLGQYRLCKLRAGRYWIYAGSGSAGNWDRRYLARYYPGTLRPEDSGQIEVEAGRERDSVDIRLTRYEGVTVSGRIETPAGADTSPRLPVSLESDTASLDMFYSPLQRDGSFIIRHVPPGDYVLREQLGNGPAKAGDLVVEQKLRVGDADERDIVIKATELRAVDLAGTILLKGGGSLSPMNIRLSGGNRPPSTLSQEDGSFILKGLLPGHYDVQVFPVMKLVKGAFDPGALPGACFPISAQLGEKEVLETGLDLDGSSDGALQITVANYIKVAGQLLDGSGEPVSGGILLALTSGPEPRPGGTAIIQADGKFTLMMQHPGDYHIYLSGGQGDLENPDYLKKHEADFPPLTVAEGANPPLALRLPAQQIR